MRGEKKDGGLLGSVLEMLALLIAEVLGAIFTPAQSRIHHDGTLANSGPPTPAADVEIEVPDLWEHRSGWSTPKPEKIPAPTYAPATMAFGIAFVALGLITRWYVSAVGAVAFLISVWLWIGELLNE